METLISDFISLGQAAGSEVLSVCFLMILYIAILFLLKFFSKEGLYLYNILAVIIANIQVLKLTSFWLISEPVALGTLLFATTFLATDILNEHFGIEAAKEGIKLSFAAQIIMTILMTVTISYPSIGGITGLSNDNRVIDSVQAGLYSLFAPSARILLASLLAYYISQWVDIRIFSYLKRLKSLLWFRSNLSTLFAGLVDNILFSSLAWVILSPSPVSAKTLFFTYIFGTYIATVIVSITSTPIIYLSYKFLPKTQLCLSHSNTPIQ